MLLLPDGVACNPPFWFVLSLNVCNALRKGCWLCLVASVMGGKKNLRPAHSLIIVNFSPDYVLSINSLRIWTRAQAQPNKVQSLSFLNRAGTAVGSFPPSWECPCERKHLRCKCVEFFCGTVGKGSGVVTALAQVAALVQVWSLAWERPHATGTTKKSKMEMCLSGRSPCLLLGPPLQTSREFTEPVSPTRGPWWGL